MRNPPQDPAYNNAQPEPSGELRVASCELGAGRSAIGSPRSGCSYQRFHLARSCSPALSPREGQVLALLRQGRSVSEVAATLFVSLSTAKTYVARLYEKHGANNRSQALMTAVQLGLFDDNDSMVS